MGEYHKININVMRGPIVRYKRRYVSSIETLCSDREIGFSSSESSFLPRERVVLHSSLSHPINALCCAASGLLAVILVINKSGKTSCYDLCVIMDSSTDFSV